MSINISFNFYFGRKFPLLRKGRKEESEYATRQESFVQVVWTEIEKSSALCSTSTTENRKTAVKAFQQFLLERGEAAIRFQDVTADHIRAFERWSLDRGLRLNYVRCNLRNLRAVVNRIDGRGRLLFEGVRTSNAQTDKRAIGEEDVRRMEDVRLPQGSMRALARQIFLFCFYAMGIPLIDAAYLRKEQLRDGYILYYRHKTHRQVKVKVVPRLREIIDQLADKRSPYLLPILTTDDRRKAMGQYRRFLQRYNRALTSIAEEYMPGVRLTSYSPRHTWASIAFKRGVSINVISQALGHANTRTTQNYIRDISGEQLDEANLTVIQCLTKKNT